MAQASLLELDTVQQRNNCDDGVDWAKITITTPGTYIISTSLTSPNSDTILQLYDYTSTNLLAENDNAHWKNRFWSEINYDFTQAGDYYIKVSNKYRGADSGYSLALVKGKSTGK